MHIQREGIATGVCLSWIFFACIFQLVLPAADVSRTVSPSTMPSIFATIATPVTAKVNQNIVFSAIASDPAGKTLTYSWDFKDGTAMGTGPGPTHAFARAGKAYPVVVSVSNGTDTVTGTVTVIITNSAPTIISGPTATPNIAQVRENVAFSIIGNDADGDTLLYTYDFGDGTTGVGYPPEHKYDAVGTYLAKFSLSDGTDTVTDAVSVMVGPATAWLGIGPDTDGDGFSDSFEFTTGTSIYDYASTPNSGLSITASVQPLSLNKTSIALEFSTHSRKPDNITIKGFASGTPQVAKIFIGSISMLRLNLNSTGDSGNGTGSFKFSRGAFYIRLESRSFQEGLKSYGLTNPPTAPNVRIPITLILDTTILTTNQLLRYSVKKKKGVAHI